MTLRRFYCFLSMQNAVESLRLTWWNVLITKLLTRPCFPTQCHQFPLPSLEKSHPIISRQWGIPTSSPSSSGVNRACWSHNEITMSEVKSCRGFFSNVLLAQSKQCGEDRKGLCSRSKVDFCAFSQVSLGG